MIIERCLSKRLDATLDYRGAFRFQLSVHDGAFLRESSIVDIRLASKYVSDGLL